MRMIRRQIDHLQTSLNRVVTISQISCVRLGDMAVGSFVLMIDCGGFVMKGIAYSYYHDWPDSANEDPVALTMVNGAHRIMSDTSMPAAAHGLLWSLA